MELVSRGSKTSPGPSQIQTNLSKIKFQIQLLRLSLPEVQPLIRIFRFCKLFLIKRTLVGSWPFGLKVLQRHCLISLTNQKAHPTFVTMKIILCTDWAIMEQVGEAAMDVKALELAFSIVNEIRQNFPNSQRAKRLTVSQDSTLSEFESKNSEELLNCLSSFLCWCFSSIWIFLTIVLQLPFCFYRLFHHIHLFQYCRMSFPGTFKSKVTMYMSRICLILPPNFMTNEACKHKIVMLIAQFLLVSE